jgi:hypothetical protein
MKKSFKGRVVLAKENSDNWYSRGYFPHFDGEGVTATCLFSLVRFAAAIDVDAMARSQRCARFQRAD